LHYFNSALVLIYGHTKEPRGKYYINRPDTVQQLCDGAEVLQHIAYASGYIGLKSALKISVNVLLQSTGKTYKIRKG